MKKYTYLSGFLLLSLYAANAHAVELKVTNNAPIKIAVIPIFKYGYGALPNVLFTVPSSVAPAGFTGNYIATAAQVTTNQNLQELLFLSADFLPQLLSFVESKLAEIKANTAKYGTASAQPYTWAAMLAQFLLQNPTVPRAFYQLTPADAASTKSIAFTVGQNLTGAPIPIMTSGYVTGRIEQGQLTVNVTSRM